MTMMPSPEFVVPRVVFRFTWVLAAIGALVFGVGLLTMPRLAWANLLLVSYLGIGVGLAGGVFVALLYVTGAGWAVGLRRVPEAMCAVLPVAGVGLLLALVAYPQLYPWSHGRGIGHSPFKDLWLERWFFLGRAVVYLAIWVGATHILLRNSRQQDADGSLHHTRRNVGMSALFLVVFGVTCWLASYDWIMSLEPEWASTVFGPYNFAGFFLGGLAVLILLALWLHRLGPFRHVLTVRHLHDLGKLLFAFSTFWAYLWFCQYMLIWYVNHPEETPYYIQRLHGAWAPLFWANVMVNWAIPFAVLLPRQAKQSAKVLSNVCLLLLLGRCLDLYLMIVPPLAAEQPLPGLMAAGLVLGAGGIFLLTIVRGLGKAPILPVKDPYLQESLR
jgi:hypothetical protein